MVKLVTKIVALIFLIPIVFKQIILLFMEWGLNFSRIHSDTTILNFKTLHNRCRRFVIQPPNDLYESNCASWILICNLQHVLSFRHCTWKYSFVYIVYAIDHNLANLQYQYALIILWLLKLHPAAMYVACGKASSCSKSSALMMDVSYLSMVF